MILLRGRVDLSPSLLEYRFKNGLLQRLFGGLPFYHLRHVLYQKTPLRRLLVRRTYMNERIVEYPYVFWQLSRHPEIKAVLDIGSAFSLLPIQLATLGYKVTGLDIIDPADLYHPNFTQVVQDLFDHKLPEASFDAVVSISTIEHMGFGVFGDKVIPDADVKAFDIVYRLLKPGGVAVITVPVGDKSDIWHRHWVDKITYFSKERIDLVTRNFEILDRRLLGKQNHWLNDAQIDYFSPVNEIGSYNVHLLTLRKPTGLS